MRTVRIALFLMGVLLVSPWAGLSHHAFTPVYDGSKVVTIAGAVTAFRFINPHALMSIDVTDATGQVVTWTVEFGGNLQLIEAGWTSESVKAGERVTVSGNPTHTGSPRIAFTRLVKTDGTALLPLGEQMLKSIEEQRRQRALAREKK